MITLLAKPFDRKFTLLQCLRHQNLHFKIFLMIYYIPNSDKPVGNDDCLKFACAEILYMCNLLAIASYIKIVLMQSLRHQNLDFKNLPTTYYIPNSDNRARNDDHLKFAGISNIQSRATRPRLCRAFYETRPWFGHTFYATIPWSGRAQLDVKNPCKL